MMTQLLWGSLRKDTCVASPSTTTTSRMYRHVRHSLRRARYSPAVSLYLEGVSEGLLLALVGVVAITCYFEPDVDIKYTSFNSVSFPWCLIGMCVTNAIYHLGLPLEVRTHLIYVNMFIFCINNCACGE